MATSLEGLLQHLGRPKALARVAAVREEASRRLGEWSHARFEAERTSIDRLLDAGRVAEAVAKAEELIWRARAASTSDAMASQLEQLAGQMRSDDDRHFVGVLQEILSGSRDPAPASDPGLNYEIAAELRLLLESLP